MAISNRHASPYLSQSEMSAYACRNLVHGNDHRGVARHRCRGARRVIGLPEERVDVARRINANQVAAVRGDATTIPTTSFPIRTDANSEAAASWLQRSITSTALPERRVLAERANFALRGRAQPCETLNFMSKNDPHLRSWILWSCSAPGRVHLAPVPRFAARHGLDPCGGLTFEQKGSS
jgi:hypothetical protein